MFQVTQKQRPALERRRRLPAPGAEARPNLEVITGAHVLGFELDGDAVTGVRYQTPAGRRAGGPTASARCCSARARSAHRSC